MKKKTWLKHHRYFGLVLAFFILMFCVSGIVLNHPELFARMELSRGVLPDSYRYKQWNNGLLRGTEKWQGKVLVYGNCGVWLTDRAARRFIYFSKGMEQGADNRNIRGLALMPGGEVFAAGTYQLYRLGRGNVWMHQEMGLPDGERISDVTSHGDSLIVTTRSRIYVARRPYVRFTPITVAAAEGEKPRVSLFRTIWWLHSGELFGLVGKLIVDGIALVLIFLSISGVLYWLLPRISRRVHGGLMKWLFSWHNQVGRLTIVLTLMICITGWLLRPPLLLLIASQRVPAVPFSRLDSENAWYDKLRSVRYDEALGDWLLYTSDGFYSLRTLGSVPQRLKVQPPVSVMGLNVQKTAGGDYWLLGSFSGLFIWQRSSGMVIDYHTCRPAVVVQGPPVGSNAVAGFSSDFSVGECVVNYSSGTARLPMPQWMATLPMSLRAVALEVHTGRLYTFLGSTTVLYIFLIGMGILWCLWTGWKLRVKK